MSTTSLHRKVEFLPHHRGESPSSSHSSAFSYCLFPVQRPRYYFNGIGYYSLSEAACAATLKEFIPGFEVIIGETFQVPIGGGASADFVVGDLVVEYHHLRFYRERRRFGDFRNKSEYRRFRRQIRQVRHNDRQRERLLARTREQLERNYYDKRRRLLNRHPLFRTRELIVAVSMEDLFEKVIQRLLATEGPSFEQFRERFLLKLEQVAKENGVSIRAA